MPLSPSIPISSRVPMLNRYHKDWSAPDVLAAALSGKGGKMAMVSSFGADSVVLLHMLAQVDRNAPVLFIDTQMLFRATLTYQAEVADVLGLTNVQHISADAGDVFLRDTEGLLHQGDTDACCALRKVEPLQNALTDYDGWISGRKRHQSAARSVLNLWEQDGDRVKLNPLFDWTHSDVQDYIANHDLPRHPLVAGGYPSLGCAPCTTRVAEGEDARAGRWRGQMPV
ncbi:MAG: phosphoadenylyl-sulfate reductase, partial [Planktomarina sp.]